MVMSKLRLRESHLRNFVEEVQQGIPVPPLKFVLPILRLRHTIHIVHGECSLQPLTPNDLLLIEELMAGGFSFPSANEALKQWKSESERKKLLSDTPHIERVNGMQSNRPASAKPSPSKPLAKKAKTSEKREW